MNKKINLFVNKIEKELRNNEKVYYSNVDRNVETVNESKSSVDLNQKINSIFKSNNYVYKANVRIKFKDKEEIKKVVGKNKNYLITLDNELIPIIDIVDVELLGNE